MKIKYIICILLLFLINSVCLAGFNSRNIKISGFNTNDGDISHNVEVYTNYKDTANPKVALIVEPSGFRTTYTTETVANITNETILTPNPGFRICVLDVVIMADAASGNVELDFATSNIKVARMYVAQTARYFAENCHLEGAIDEVLGLTTTTGANDVFVLVNYVEHK